jgi:hypothetical protein
MCIICLNEYEENELVTLGRGSGTYHVCHKCLGIKG